MSEILHEDHGTPNLSVVLMDKGTSTLLWTAAECQKLPRLAQTITATCLHCFTARGLIESLL